MHQIAHRIRKRYATHRAREAISPPRTTACLALRTVEKKLFWADLSDVAEATDETRLRVRRVHTVGKVECHTWHKSSVQPALLRVQEGKGQRMGATQYHTIHESVGTAGGDGCDSGIAVHVSAYLKAVATAVRSRDPALECVKRGANNKPSSRPSSREKPSFCVFLVLPAR